LSLHKLAQRVPGGSPCSAKTVLAFARLSRVGAKKKGMPL